MFISNKPTIQTSLFLLLFIAVAKCFVLNGKAMSVNLPDHFTDATNQETIQLSNQIQTCHTPNIDSNDSSKTDASIRFNINPEIQYLSINHFQQKEARDAYLQARQKEAELLKSSLQTDSLRKLYSKAPNVEKETIAEEILKNEEKSTGLNQQISSLFQLAHDKEDQFWSEQTPEKRKNLQKLILC